MKKRLLTLLLLPALFIAAFTAFGATNALHAQRQVQHTHVQASQAVKVSSKTKKITVPLYFSTKHAGGSLNSIPGNCGTATFYIQEAPGGGGFAQFAMSINGAPSNIDAVYYVLQWSNQTTGETGNDSGTVQSYFIGGQWSYTTIPEYTDAGYVVANASYAAHMSNGNTCYSAPGLQDGELIS